MFIAAIIEDVVNQENSDENDIIRKGSIIYVYKENPTTYEGTLPILSGNIRIRVLKTSCKNVKDFLK